MKYLLIFAICAVFFFIFTPLVLADSGIPDGVEVFYVDGLVCIVWPDGSGECHCPCDAPLEVCDKPQPTPQPTEAPRPPGPTPTPPEPTPTPKPQPTPKPACNRGLGNGPEFCDPGNSGGKPGNAGEDNE